MKLKDIKNQFGITTIMKQEDLTNHLESAYWLLWKVKDMSERAKVDWIRGDINVVLDRIKSLIKAVEVCDLELEEHGIEKE